MIEKRLIKRLTTRLRKLYADLETPPVLDMSEFFPAHLDLEAQVLALRSEALTVFRENPNVPRFHDILVSSLDGTLSPFCPRLRHCLCGLTARRPNGPGARRS